MNESVKLDQEVLMEDLRNVISDTEALLDDVSKGGSAEARALRQKIAENLSVARAKLQETERLVGAKAKEAARVTDTYVHDHPWTAVGVAAGVGFLLGLLVSRR
ncbi:DUF883 family protein [Chitinibacteraceae bacterium HSL-7]